MENPPYSPDLAPASFYLIPRLKSALKGRRFCHADVIKNVTEELKRLSTKCLPGTFPTPIQSLAQVYIQFHKGTILKEI